MIEIEEYEKKAKEFHRRGEFINAIEYHKKALSLKGKYLGIKNLHTASSYNSLARLYSALEEYEEALLFQNKSLEIVAELLDNEHIDMATNWYNIASIYFKMNKIDEALDFHKKALDIRVKELGTENVETAYSLAGLSKVFEVLEKNDAALQYFNYALNVLEKNSEGNEIFIANIYDELGALYYKLEEFNKVEDFCFKSLKIKKELFGENHLQVAITYYNLAIFLFNEKKNYAEAYKYMKKCVDIRKNFLPKKHSDLIEAVDILKMIKRVKGNKH